MYITGTHFNYYQVCKRKLWLFANGIGMEQTSDLVYEGKLIHEDSYPQRPERYEELEIDGIKIDFYDSKNKIIHETKKSDKLEEAHEWQVKYYIYVLEKNGIEGVTAVLEYPVLRKKHTIILSNIDKEMVQKMEMEIKSIIELEKCPPVVHGKKRCTSCSYFEFCYVGEVE
jgi:CRISPR-associated exonuclease Cas4